MNSPSGMTINRPRSLVATVAERLRQGIIDAEIALGSELSEAGLAETMGVSRTPIREALSLLQQQGLVVIIPQKGSYVFFPTEQDIIDLCEYRLLIENGAVSFAMTRNHGATLKMLEESVSDMKAARDAGDPVAYTRADTTYHEAFLKNCENRYLQNGYTLVAGKIATLRTHLSIPLAGVQDRSFVHHLQIIEEFEKRKLAAIEAILTEHILATRTSYLLALQQGLMSGIPLD